MSQLGATRCVLITELAAALGLETLTAKVGSPLYDFIQRTAETIVNQSVESKTQSDTSERDRKQIEQLEDRVAILQQERDELKSKLINMERWENGFRNIVSRIHGARKEFEIQDIVDKVSAIESERDGLRRKHGALLVASKPVCTWWVKFKQQYPQFSYGDIDSSTYAQRTIIVSAANLDSLAKQVLSVEELRGTGIVQHKTDCNHFLPGGICDCGAVEV